MTLLKICGLRQSDQAAAIAAMGIDAIGVIAVPGSPRYVPATQRPALFAAVRQANPGCQGVLVVADPNPGLIDELRPGWGHQVVQLHGDETPEQCRQLRDKLDGVILWKALRVRSRADLQRARTYQGCVDALLLDAWVSGQLGGTGVAIPLELLQAFEPPLPWWLAGGIREASAAAALAVLQPTGLDASSGVERSPGDKDPARVAALLAVVRAAMQA
ncbi:MAG: phosphoribosylanthranilate isomerase, partial [Synechococcaceae bacterium WB9_2_112]|nr:phosphoribosylanthranilate isomerase [Synechococcaceae bacterium WB9_2_112]